MKCMEHEDLVLLLSLLNAYRNDPDLHGEVTHLIRAGFETEAKFDARTGTVRSDYVMLFGLASLECNTVQLAVSGSIVGGHKRWQCLCSFAPTVDALTYPARAKSCAEEPSAMEAIEQALKDSVAWILHKTEFEWLEKEYARKADSLLRDNGQEAIDWMHGVHTASIKVEPDGKSDA